MSETFYLVSVDNRNLGVGDMEEAHALQALIGKLRPVLQMAPSYAVTASRKLMHVSVTACNVEETVFEPTDTPVERV